MRLTQQDRDRLKDELVDLKGMIVQKLCNISEGYGVSLSVSASAKDAVVCENGAEFANACSVNIFCHYEGEIML